MQMKNPWADNYIGNQMPFTIDFIVIYHYMPQ